MLLLTSLKTKSGEKISVIKEVAPHWTKFALGLDFDPNGTTIQTIERKRPTDPEACCQEMLEMWLQGKGRQPATWKLLVEILHDFCDLNVLANKIEDTLLACLKIVLSHVGQRFRCHKKFSYNPCAHACRMFNYIPEVRCM